MNTLQKLMLLGVMGGGQQSYADRMRALFGSALVGYWPLDDLSGTVARDISGRGFHGTYSNVAVNNSLSKQGRPVPLFNGTSSEIALPTMAGVFNGQEGGVSMWINAATGTWADGLQHWMLYLQADASNYVSLRDNAGALTYVYDAAAAYEANAPVFNAENKWVNLAWTWSKSLNKLDNYINGGLMASQACTGAFTGNLATTRISSAGGYWGWNGFMSDVVLANRYITTAEARVLAQSRNLSILGDSVSAGGAFVSYYDTVTWSYTTPLAKINHAAAGASIAAQLAGQVTAAASDQAGIIILALGTNDNNAGNMTTLQATVETAIDNLRASNPGTAIYYMNVLPRWTDNTGATPVDKGNIRTAIAAACTAKGITCWDTFTTPWIAAADTSDGLHPTAAGHAKIATQVLARL